MLSFACNSYVSDVVQKAVIIVDEKGTEAAAATGMMMNCLSMAMGAPSIPFTVDHPFLYSIINKETHNILFMGVCTKPIRP